MPFATRCTAAIWPTPRNYPLAAQRGLRLFFGEGRCTTCHAGPSFTNGEFGDIGIPFFVRAVSTADATKGLEKLLASPYNRLGAFQRRGAEQDPRAVSTRHVTLQPRHFGEFRVPSLRQLTHTAPYMHNGSVATLEAVVNHYSEPARRAAAHRRRAHPAAAPAERPTGR